MTLSPVSLVLVCLIIWKEARIWYAYLISHLNSTYKPLNNYHENQSGKRVIEKETSS
jgi:hypothetical protein